MTMLINVTTENLSWAHEVSGQSWDFLLDALLEAKESGMPCVVECLS